MKKRTLVCFLIFLLCVFHSSIPDTVFGQEADPTPAELAQTVYDEFSETLLRDDLQDLTVQVLAALSDPATVQNPLIVGLGGFEVALNLVLATPSLITQVVADEDGTIQGLIKDDEDVRRFLMEPNARALMQNHLAVIELLRLLFANETWKSSLTETNLQTLQEVLGVEPPEPPEPPAQAPPTISITTSRPTTPQQGSFNVAFTTADVNGDAVTVTASISVDPVEAASYYSSTVVGNSVRVTQTAPTEAMPTITGATVTLTLVANDGTADSTPATIVITFSAAELPPEPPPEPPDKPEPPTGDELPTVGEITSNLKGQSRVGGLSLNRVHGRAFIRGLIVEAAGQGVLDALDQDPNDLVEPIVDYILSQVPKGFLPKKQIRQILTGTQPWSIFAEEPDSQLDFENFGNAITPSLVISDFSNISDSIIANEVKKYLTSDNLNVYVRVPSTLLGGNVQFGINGYKAADATRITPLVFQQDTIPYTFRLEETLAAINLPALPDAEFGGNKIFSGVVLRYSQTGIDGEYISVDMEPMEGEKGVVWVSEIGVPPPREGKDPAANIYYYFEVTLSEPVTLEVINPAALGAAANSVDGTFDPEEVGEATKTYEIDSWAMPDPKNLQLQDRGIFKELFTADVRAKLTPIALSVIAGENLTGRQQRQLLNAVLNSVNDLFTRFETTFDPMLVSVFSLPHVDITKESLWYANLDGIADGKVNFEARVMNVNGEVVDHIAVNNLTADDSAPEADINITTAEQATGYWNKDGVFVSTGNPTDTPALINITSTVTKGSVGHGEGYLAYQIIKLDEHGRPLSTWLPLTVENSMLASEIWDLVIDNLPDDLKEFPIPGTDQTINISAFPLNLIISALQGDVPIPGADIEAVIIDAIEDIVGIRISENQYALLADILGAVVDDLNLFPLTSDPSIAMTMPIQGENLPLLLGDYGIRAMGVDSLFNFGSHVGPTRLRVVLPEWDRTSITMASLGDLNGDGDADEPYESGVIYVNATDVTLTIAVNERSGMYNHDTAHPATIMVQYENADGDWVTIGDPIDLDEAGHPNGTTFEHPWTVTDFDDLIGASEVVRVRTVTTNALDLTTTTPEEDYFKIKLDADVHPVDPKVLVVDFNDNSIVMTNPDSGAPQGTVQLIGYTPRRTIPETTSILVEARRMKDADDAWAAIGTVEMGDPNGMSGVDTAAMMFNETTLGEIYPSDASMIHIDETSSYLKWTITVDTTMLEDTIDMGNLAAAHAASNPDGTSYIMLDDNRYMVRATPVADGDLPDNPNENPMAEGETYTDTFSVDNVDDVAPLGQNMITVSQDGMEVTPNEDGSFDVGGLVDKYDPEVDSPVITLMISPGAKRDTYETVNLYTSLPEGAIVGDVAETAADSGKFAVTVDVGTLMDEDGLVHNDRYLEDVYHENLAEFIYNPKSNVFSFTVYALSEDETGNEQVKDDILNADLSTTTAHEITINVQNTYRDDPGVIAITVENSDGMVNPDSGAPQGELTFNVYTYYITSPPTEGIRVEVKRPIDETWERITGTAVAPVEVDISDVPGIADLDDITGGLVGITQAGTASGGESVVAIPGRYMKWQFIVDTRELALEDTVTAEGTIKLDDTITRGDASERDVSVDENQYEVRAISLTPKNLDHPEYPQRDGVEASFSLDNVDDVPPLGPTNIVGVSDRDAYGDMQPIEANEDGSYTVGGIVDQGVNSPAGIFHIQPTAEEITYAGGSLQLIRTNPDGTEAEPAVGSLADGYIEVDVGLLDNGTYMYHALTVDEHGNVQVQGEADMPSPIVTVHVLNFRVSDIMDLTVTSVDGVMVDGELPERIPLRESIGVSFNVPNGTLMVGDLTAVHVNGEQAAFAAGSDAENVFSLMASELSMIASGHYTVRGEVTKRNGSVTFPLAMVNLDNTAPMISFISPVEGEAINDLPTLHAEFNDGDLGVGISLGTAMVGLARIRPDSDGQEDIAIDVDQSMVEQDIDSVVYTRIDKLAGGAYKFTVQVTDSLGNVGEASVAYAVEGIDPTVVITAPASGQEFDASPASVTGFFAGGGEVSITSFTVNDEDVSESVSVEGNNFTYMPADGFSEDAHTVAVEVTDGSGLTSQTALTFTVEYPVPTATITTPAAGQVYNHGMPIITGSFSGADPVIGTLSIDGEGVMVVDGNDFTYKPTEALSDGEHTVTLAVTDVNGNTAEAMTEFTINISGPSVAIHSPAAGQMYDHGMPSITVEASGVADPVMVSVMVNGEAATMNDDGTYSPATELGDGEHTVMATATDANGKTAEATVIFSVEIPGPSVSIISPAAGQMYDHGMPVILVESSGVAAPVVVSVMVNDEAATMNDDGTYSPATALGDGEHTVMATATDANGKTAEATVIISVEIPGPSIDIHSPASGQMYDHGMPVITVESSGVADPVSVSVMVNDEAATMNDDGTYSPATALGDGEHTVMATATDANGKTAEATVIFSVEIPGPSVSIISPAAGQMYDHGMPVITVESTGVAEPISVSVMVNGEAATMNDDGTYSPATALGDGEHTVMATATDANGKTAEATVIFSVEIPGPSVALISPAAGQMYSYDEPVITWESSGVAGPISTSLTINGDAVELADGADSYTPDEGLGEGEHTVVVMVTDANGKTAQATAVFTVEFPMASVTLTSPTAGHTYSNGMPVISGEFTGVGEVAVKLTVDGKDTKVSVEGNQFTGELAGALGHGMHTVAVEITDANGESAMTSAEFMVDLPAPTVAILSPAPGQTYGNGETAVIRVEFSGMDASVTSFTINGEDVEVEPEDNMFMHTPEGLTTGEYVVAVEVKDAANNKTAMDTVVFNVKLDSTPPVIAEVAPSGTLKDTWVNISVAVADDQSDITAVDFFIRNEADTHKGFLPLGTVIAGAQNSATTQQIVDGNILTQGSFGPGTHTLKVVATSEGGSSSHTWSFTVVTDNIKPTITSITPSGTLHAGLPTISASAHDESGVAEIVITVMDSSGEAIEGKMQNDDEEGSVGITRSDFMPGMPLVEGTYVIEVRATDTYGNTSSAKGSFTIDFDTAAPLITSSSPQDGARLMYAHDDEKRPTISVTYGDAETGVNVDSIRFVFNDKLINLTDDQKSATQVIYMPPADLEPGQYTVKIEVSDNAQMQGNVSDEAEGAREANTAVYEFSFFVEHGEVPILKAAPFNYPNPFTDKTRISFVLARRSNVSITIFDVTLRPVRVLADNEVMEAGYYTRSADGSGSNAIGWDGKSSNGEDLARGIYFCQIMVTDGVEPEYAILKLALTR